MQYKELENNYKSLENDYDVLHEKMKEESIKNKQLTYDNDNNKDLKIKLKNTKDELELIKIQVKDLESKYY